MWMRDWAARYWLPFCFFATTLLLAIRDLSSWVTTGSLDAKLVTAHLVIPLQGVLWWVFVKVDDWLPASCERCKLHSTYHATCTFACRRRS